MLYIRFNSLVSTGMCAIKVREQDTFIAMDAADEQQILREMEGEIVKDLYYDVNGKKGLSYAGVNHMAFKVGNIRVIPGTISIEYDEREDEYTAMVMAENTKYNLSAPGVAVVPRMMKHRDGSTEKDIFAKIKAVSKATRNAKKAVMPEALIAAYLDYFIKLKQGAKTAQPQDSGPVGMKDPRKVDAEFKVVDPAALHDQHDEDARISLETDIIDSLTGLGIDPNGIEITKGRDWNQFIIKPNWPKDAPRETWGRYHEALKSFGAKYHGKDDVNCLPEHKYNWTIGV